MHLWTYEITLGGTPNIRTVPFFYCSMSNNFPFIMHALFWCGMSDGEYHTLNFPNYLIWTTKFPPSLHKNAMLHWVSLEIKFPRWNCPHHDFLKNPPSRSVEVHLWGSQQYGDLGLCSSQTFSNWTHLHRWEWNKASSERVDRGIDFPTTERTTELKIEITAEEHLNT